MNLRALRPEQRTAIFGHVESALAAVRAVIEIAPDVGPVLVQSYRALSVLRELREVAEMLPTIPEEKT